MTKVFIDGSAGTTGLRIYDRLSTRKDIELITLSDDVRKDPEARKEAINSVDIAFLCLPDAAAMESVTLVENDNTVIIDTSTAHRTNEGWTYGFPEVSEGFKENLRTSKRIAVPGCYASGFIALVKPLVDEGIISKDALISCHAVSGYSGAGKNAIAQYEDEGRDPLLGAPREYALTQQHKHLKEMRIISGLESEPIFCPYICDYYSGMVMTVPFFKKDLAEGKTIDDIKALYKEKYNSEFVMYKEAMDESGFVSANKMSGKDNMEVTVCGNDERILLIARYDNLGKGASGAAIECMNIALGLDASIGLDIEEV